MLGQIIREQRINRGMTQDKFAERLHISKSTVSMYENNQRKPNYEMLEAIADVLNIDISVLFYGTNADEKSQSINGEDIVLSDAEKELLEKFRRLSAERQALAIQLLAPLEGGQ